MRHALVAVGCTFALLLAIAARPRAQADTLPYDHIHLNVPDQAAAAAWYEKHFGGTRIDEAPNRLMYGSTRLMFLRSDKAQPSMGSSIDHLGFSVQNLEATMKELEAEGVKITSPMRDVQGLFKLAFVEDPWGTRIEVVEDADLLGLHHLHLRAPDPEEMFKWLLGNFGGERTKLKGRIEAVKYSAATFSDVWILVTKGEAAPSDGRAIDHIGWRATNLDAKVAELKGKGVKVTTEPRPLTLANKTTIHFAYVEGPAGTKIELVQR